MADGALRERLDARLMAARRGLMGPELARAFGPLGLWTAAFALFWLSGLAGRWPEPVEAALGLLFWAGAIALAWLGRRRWTPPTEDDARDLIDDAIEGRPLSAWADRPARADADAFRLWAAHRERMARQAIAVSRIDLDHLWRRRDRFYLRFAAPALVALAMLLAAPATFERLRAGLGPDVGALFGAHTLTVEAWVTPPAYTGAAPFVIEAGGDYTAPVGSEVTLRVSSPGQPSVRVDPDRGRARTIRPELAVDGAYEARIVVDAPMRVGVRFWGERAAYAFAVIDDLPPVVEFVTEPKLGSGDKTEFEWRASDDYGVAALELVAGLADPPEGAEGLEETVAVELTTLEPREDEGAYSQDLTRHRWAGLDVMVRLRATDASGRTGESAEVAYRLPEKLFFQPLAQAAAEIRAVVLREWREYGDPAAGDGFAAIEREGLEAFGDIEASRIELAPEGVRKAAVMLDALTFRPEDYFVDPALFLGFRHARATLGVARAKAEAEHVDDILWEVALRAEFGSLADAAAALEAARRALEEALRNGASEEEIRRLMEAFREAVENYLAAQMAEALREGRVQMGENGQPQDGRRPLDDDALQRMMDALQGLAETGAADQARQLLNQMADLLAGMENMQLQMSPGGQGGEPQDGPMSRALERAMRETGRALNEQRDLNDETEQAMREGGGQERGQELADRQRELRERLERGEGQPGEGEQGEGETGSKPGGREGEGAGEREGEGREGPGQGREQEGEPGGGGRPGSEPNGRFADRDPGGDRRRLAEITDAQRRAEEALRRGDFEGARRAQQQAMDALAARSGELARRADSEDADAESTAGRERDPLGRFADGATGFGEDVEVPDEMERKRARDILDELRRRAGDRQLRAEEQEYLQRLLDRF